MNRIKSLSKTSRDSIGTDAFVNECYAIMIKSLDTKITLSNIVKIITQCMKIVQTFKKLNGIEKKDLVIDVVQKLIRGSDHNEEVEDILIDILEKIGHPIIDTIVIASKGGFFYRFTKLRWCGI
tara:strand:- start:1587 stop:1958 length:372 start_codon:yes stop_codon:yes gene_type:complete